MKKTIYLLLLLMASGTVYSQKASDIEGVWWTEDRKAKVKIYEKNGEYFGRLTWLREELDENGKVKRDKNNPDESKRSRKLKGLVILRKLEWNGEDEWEGGKIYDPKKGKSYSCYARLGDSRNELNLRGYIGFSMIGRTSTWTRAE